MGNQSPVFCLASQEGNYNHRSWVPNIDHCGYSSSLLTVLQFSNVTVAERFEINLQEWEKRNLLPIPVCVIVSVSSRACSFTPGGKVLVCQAHEESVVLQ
jgi:hypothetical protein